MAIRYGDDDGSDHGEMVEGMMVMVVLVVVMVRLWW